MSEQPRRHIQLCGYRGEGTIPYMEISRIFSGAPLRHTSAAEVEDLGTVTLRNFTAVLHNGYERFESLQAETGLFVIRSLSRIETHSVSPANNELGRRFSANTTIQAQGRLIHIEPTAYRPADVPVGVLFDGNSASYDHMQLVIENYRRKDVEVTGVVRSIGQSMIQQFMQ